MNRSILIIICDFLLVSLLVFSTPDISKLNQEKVESNVSLNVPTNQVTSQSDLADVMRQALQDEQQRRDAVLQELRQTQRTTEEQRAALAQRQQQIKNFQQQLTAKEAETQRLEEQKRMTQQQLQAKETETQRLQEQQRNAQQQFAKAQSRIQNLNQQLTVQSAETRLSKVQLDALKAELKKQAEQAARLQQNLTQLAHSNRMVLDEKQELSTQLRVAEVEKRHAVEQATQLRQQVETERAEKAVLAEGVKVLADKSGQLAQEIRENRPEAPNTIFHQFLTNKVEAQFTAVRVGWLGESTQTEAAGTVLVTDGTNTFAVCHVQGTPFTLRDPGTDWQQLSGSLRHNDEQVPIRTVSFQFQDPRIVVIPVEPADVETLGCGVYRLATDPYKFQDAVLVGAQEGYYGQCRFEIDPNTPSYVRLDRSFLKGLFGQFNPSRGDLVFSRNGELLGIMANNSYCLRIQDFETMATVRFGPDVSDQHTGQTLSRLYASVSRLPSELR